MQLFLWHSHCLWFTGHQWPIFLSVGYSRRTDRWEGEGIVSNYYYLAVHFPLCYTHFTHFLSQLEWERLSLSSLRLLFSMPSNMLDTLRPQIMLLLIFLLTKIIDIKWWSERLLLYRTLCSLKYVELSYLYFHSDFLHCHMLQIQYISQILACKPKKGVADKGPLSAQCSTHLKITLRDTLGFKTSLFSLVCGFTGCRFIKGSCLWRRFLCNHGKTSRERACRRLCFV